MIKTAIGTPALNQQVKDIFTQIYDAVINSPTESGKHIVQSFLVQLSGENLDVLGRYATSSTQDIERLATAASLYTWPRCLALVNSMSKIRMPAV